MKSYFLIIPALAFAVASANAYTPAAPSPVPPAYKPPASEPLPPVATAPPPQPVPPPPPHIVLPQSEEEPLGAYEVVDEEDDEPGFVVQNGFEGYIIPSEMVPKAELPAVFPLLASLFGLIKLPKALFALGPLFGNGLLALGAIAAVGAAFCTFTPFCAITLFPFRSEEVKSALESSRMKSAVEFVANSIDKYRTIVKQIEDAAAQNTARKNAARKNAAKASNVSKKRRR